jgi:hypothetical protein
MSLAVTKSLMDLLQRPSQVNYMYIFICEKNIGYNVFLNYNNSELDKSGLPGCHVT